MGLKDEAHAQEITKTTRTGGGGLPGKTRGDTTSTTGYTQSQDRYMSEFIDSAEELVERAEEAAQADGINRLKEENRVVGDACEIVNELSSSGNLTNSQLNALADQLADTLARYTKTDLKEEFQEHFAQGSEGVPFDELIEERLETVQTVHSTDAKQGTVWRWNFSDGVKLETQTSKDGGRKHYDWGAFKRDYFDSLVSQGHGQKIAPPNPELKQPEAWQDWIDDILLRYADPVEHVGPRTEAVRMLRDYISRNVAFIEMRQMRERNGLWVDASAESEDETAADGGVGELRVPVDEIKRICDQIGVSTRALQIELEARGLTHTNTNGVSGAQYIDGVRIGYWSLSPNLADPKEIIKEVKSPAEKAAERETERVDETRTTVGAVESQADEDGQEFEQTASEPLDPDLDDEEEYQPGMTNSFGTDPDANDKDD